MLINNITSPSRDVFVAIGKLGKIIPAGIIGMTISDEYGDNDIIRAEVANGNIEITGYDADSKLSAAEVETIVRGLYKISLDNTPGGVSGSLTSAVIDSGAGEVFDLQTNNRLSFLVDGIYSVVVEVPKGVYTADALFAALNGDSDFSEHLVASATADPTPKLRVTANSKGVNSKIRILSAEYYDANSELEFSSTEEVGTGVTSLVKLKLNSSTGDGFAKGQAVVGIYDASTGGALTGTGVIQRVVNGVIVGTLYTDELIIKSSIDGSIEFEVYDTSGPFYVEVAVPSNFFLASALTSRIEVAVA